MLSEAELSRWEEAFGQDGIAGLQAKRLLTRLASTGCATSRDDDGDRT
jgi:hypothetical protein